MRVTEAYVGIVPSDARHSAAWHPSGRVLEFDADETGFQQLLRALQAEPPRLIVVGGTGQGKSLCEKLCVAGFLAQTAAPHQVPQIAHVSENVTIDAKLVALVASRVRISGTDFDPKCPRAGLAQLWPPFPQFDVPEGSESVWRYMDVTKLVSLLEKRALYFPSARQFDDVFEGSYPLKNSISRLAKATPEEIERIAEFRKKLRDWHFISCWHLSEVESAALWEIYGPRQSSIAVRSTFGALRGSIIADGLLGGLLFAKVRYLDYENEGIPGQLAAGDVSPFIYKAGQDRSRQLNTAVPLRETGVDHRPRPTEEKGHLLPCEDSAQSPSAEYDRAYGDTGCSPRHDA